ncbi:MAG: hypothetical protein IV100_15855 [Myxococcales bacterium]|nr:hypothetical protein [Myxococcales bacterium]
MTGKPVVPQIYDDIPDVGTPSSHVKVDVTNRPAPPPPPPSSTSSIVVVAAAQPPPPPPTAKPSFAFVPCLLVSSVAAAAVTNFRS